MVETGECGDVGTRARHRSDDTCLFAELRYGIVARQHENGFKCGYISAQTLYLLRHEAVDVLLVRLGRFLRTTALHSTSTCFGLVLPCVRLPQRGPDASR